MICPKCGAELAEQAKFCSQCGMNLENAGSGKEKKKPRIGVVIVGILIAAILIISAITCTDLSAFFAVVAILALVAVPVTLVGFIVMLARRKAKKQWILACLIAAVVFVVFMVLSITVACEHNFVTSEIVQATCIAEGKVVSSCENCRKEEVTVTPATGHTIEEASCITPKMCVICGETWGDVGAHTWGEANCVAPKTCSVCGETEGTPIAHTWWDATCEVPKTCAECGKTEGNPLEHTWEEANCVDAETCTACGLTQGEPLGHQWVDATCVILKTCSVCGETEGELAEHSITYWRTTQRASCTEKGKEQGTCTVCKATEERDIEKLAHTPGEWVITEMPTKSTEGEHIKKCKVCGTELEREKFSLTEAELAAEYKKNCKSIAYNNLARSPGDYEGEYVKFRGKVVQVCSEAKSSLYYSTYRVATSGSYNNVVYIYVDNYGSGSRILEDDWITFYGEFDGLYTYTTVMGASVTIPSIKVEYVE